MTEVADRLGVSRQSVHRWIARYEQGGLPALADWSHRPEACSHQIAAELEAIICEIRRQHPGWGTALYPLFHHSDCPSERVNGFLRYRL